MIKTIEDVLKDVDLMLKFPTLFRKKELIGQIAEVAAKLREREERPEARFNAVVTKLVPIHGNEETGKPQFATYTHIECKDNTMLERLQELARKLTLIPTPNKKEQDDE